MNGEAVADPLPPGSYARVERRWRAGDVVQLDLPLRVRLVEGNPRIESVRNQVAVLRGPLVYCLESADLPAGVEVADVFLPPDITFEPRHVPSLLGGVTVLEGQADVVRQPEWGATLYRDLAPARLQPQIVRLIPYYAWANRGVGEMTVWLPLSHR